MHGHMNVKKETKIEIKNFNPTAFQLAHLMLTTKHRPKNLHKIH